MAMDWSVRASGEQHSSDFLFVFYLGPVLWSARRNTRGIGDINGVNGTGMSVWPRNMDRMSERASGSGRVRDYCVKFQALVYDILPWRKVPESGVRSVRLRVCEGATL